MGNSRFKFSVIIPVYNVENYLEETIQSVIHQTIGFKKNIQIILVNDGSPDDSGKICEKYQREYPDNIVYVEQKNAGVSAARNNGLKYAEGEIINFWILMTNGEKLLLSVRIAFFKNTEMRLILLPAVSNILK